MAHEPVTSCRCVQSMLAWNIYIKLLNDDCDDGEESLSMCIYVYVCVCLRVYFVYLSAYSSIKVCIYTHVHKHSMTHAYTHPLHTIHTYMHVYR